jgi:cysteine desulfurase/selenocysteine lyase
VAQEQPIYLNTASCGLISPDSLAAATALYTGFEHNSSGRSEAWRIQEEAGIRATIANFIGANAANVAMVPNFSWAINGIVQSLKGTEKVLLYAKDYPSFLEPFRINKFDITWIDTEDGFNIDMASLSDAISNKLVDIVALSHVQWTSGYKTDLKAIGDLCRQHGVLFMVDGTQSLGACVINLSELNVAVFAASHYKWMNAGFGNGTLYVSDSFLQKYPPVVGGHNSYRMVGNEWQYVPSVLSYEPGSPNMFGFTLVTAAIQHKKQLGLTNIEQHNLGLTNMLLTQLRELPTRILGDHTMTNRAPIIYLIDENGLGDFIKSHNIVVTQRNGYLRVSTHFHNTEEDVLALTQCMRLFYSV